MIHVNRGVEVAPEFVPSDLRPLEFHRRLPGYMPTPRVELCDLPGLPESTTVSLKDESARFGLSAFKILGASWAAWRALRERIGPELDGWDHVRELARRLSSHRPLELVAATAGNHGRAVARTASWFGIDSLIFVPADTAAERVAAIEREGARVVHVDGDYDRAVDAVESIQRPESILLQDTSRPGREKIPLWVIDGYSTLGREIDESIASSREPPVDLVVVQIGVGSLASAVVRHFKRAGASNPPRVVGVEPVDSACALEALCRGAVHALGGKRGTMMAGLACGSIASVAWPWLSRGLDGVITIDDARAAEAMSLLATRGVVSGESGAAGLAGLLELRRAPVEVRERLGLRKASRVLLFSTEGDTDPRNYRRIVGRSPISPNPG